MCSFGSCQTRFEFLSQFRKVRNAFECFVTQVQTRLPKTKCVWPMKINVICKNVLEKHKYKYWEVKYYEIILTKWFLLKSLQVLKDITLMVAYGKQIIESYY